jgi:hypothetical protein
MLAGVAVSPGLQDLDNNVSPIDFRQVFFLGNMKIADGSPKSVLRSVARRPSADPLAFSRLAERRLAKVSSRDVC